MKKIITQDELEKELKTLKEFGLTDEEIEGYVDRYYKSKFDVVTKKVRVLNGKKRKTNVKQ